MATKNRGSNGGGRKKKVEPPPKPIPEQDRHICGLICVCQLTFVLSSVSLVYLSVAIYLPGYRAFNAAIETVPIMCQTINSTVSNNCEWASCGEWCLTKASGNCPQYLVTVRQNGTEIGVENCTRLTTVSCPQANPETLKRYNCNNNKECLGLTGIMACRLGHCSNMSELYQCYYNTSNSELAFDSDRENLKLNGYFHCDNGSCKSIKWPFACDRYCNKITTTGVNVFLRLGDTVYTGDCQRVVAYNKANGNATQGEQLATPREIWTDENSTIGIFMASCNGITKDSGNSLRAIDCINGTVLDESLMPQLFINFTTFWTIYESSNRLLDENNEFVPTQSSLTVFNSSRLYINQQGCVNTLRNECKDFSNTHGRAGDNHTAQSRFPCFYTKNDSFSALARFDLNKTWWELMIGVTVPGILFAISFLTLLIVHQTVKVGDDARMTCQWCADDDAAAVDEPFMKPNQTSKERKQKKLHDEMQELSVIEALVAKSADIAVGRPLTESPDV
ncbi:uncharacterized protein LOC112690272 isoform X1 [Sipha flava]|uniref:Uncharacterized protein LOC112690272 isoform X1 n=1 Tax=Sipha flava TaxID=143950 RepID=A0A8B8GBA0_9HEMI|nr:uncharacterized protein LOC112690272 isoform X1 [Sipha flava]XP_025420029.1 uncharacterized protein LOC112690272 isoform X1 [Sipha flava]XP_025420030.1 uncharacterized protein LOC112690272 isoform X1 [Sipha flava]XP_025420031.1 uncharacterized protein LOC112690272 isoform X1 [Sipha flava]